MAQRASKTWARRGPRRVGERARVLLSFAAFGLFWGAWGAVLPAVQRRAGVDDGQLGLALLLIGLGALLSMRATGQLVDRRGGRVLPVIVFVFAGCGVLPALARPGLALAGALLLVGAVSGAMDVAINAAGVRVEVRSGRRMLNLAHACFSAAVVAASLITGGLRAAGAGPAVVLAGVAGLLGLTALAVRVQGGGTA